MSRDRQPSPARGSFSGVIAAVVWALSEPLLQRLFQTSYSDARLLGTVVTRNRWWPLFGFAMHLANGAMFGWLFVRLGLAEPGQGIIAAETENLMAWPALALVDRIHPQRRTDRDFPLLSNRRVFAQEVVSHAIFGALLGRLLRD